MERFIDVNCNYLMMPTLYLKSSMERFIEMQICNKCGRAILFKIQYGEIYSWKE